MTNSTKVNEKLSPLSEKVMNQQATINIGTIGHVAHGKTTLVKAISGVLTQRYTGELKNNCTIKLGYANAKIFKCLKCKPPECYSSAGSEVKENPKCRVCNSETRLVRHVSFVDCPGHEVLMATMLNGAQVMDAALLLVSANEKVPQPQTKEHLAAMEIMKMKNILVLQNKVDLLTREQVSKNYKDIKSFISGTIAQNAPLIPISAQLGFEYNLDTVCQYIVERIPVPIRDFSSPPRMMIVRSFDVNKPGFSIQELKGGVAGGTLLQGILKKNQKAEIRPGIIRKVDEGFKCTPILTTITSLHAAENSLEFAIPGGLIGVGTTLDPTHTKSDRLLGQLLGTPGTLPPIFESLTISINLLSRVVGTKESEEVDFVKMGETLLINVGANSTFSKIIKLKHNYADVTLSKPVCANVGDKVSISRKINRQWRLIGYGNIIEGKEAFIEYN